MARTALVTGAGGFIGGHLAAALVCGGSRVRAFLRYNSRGERGSLEWHDQHVVRDMEVVFGDLRDVESVQRAVSGADVVFHLGAQIAIPYSYVNARDFFETNVLGTLNVAEAALRAGVGRVVHTSTSEVYGTARTAPMTEEHPLTAQSPYAASKTGGDQLMGAFHRSHQLPVTVLRPFNTYGPHQSARAVTTTVITQALAGGTLRLGELDTRRDLTFVSDTVAGFLAAAQSDAAVGRTVHLGTGHDVSVAELVTAVGDLLGRKLTVNVDETRLRPPHSEVARLVSNPALARELLGWAPQVDLDAGLTATIGWIKSNMSRFRVGEYSR
ncbi:MULTISPECIES: SDR family NAD(P)-dependent oxidoreductase [Protofrankia]|uniref:dTDP-glucose 4,6-dehydratase n=1 Tax=Candidatus Protofrankia datiscae TaxID=2716812 RepID=F8B0G6_9ACTN|nr:MULTISPECIES: SDR family NAD(P)-dependent oxidoreductase [Protofrankia]AEH09715.1 dTDP-glucose 4,6-dehydratase [Candidatus Protofrankia datiscae]